MTKVSDYLEEWVMWGGIPYQRGEIYRWMDENGVRFLQAADGPAIDPGEALDLRQRCEEAGVV